MLCPLNKIDLPIQRFFSFFYSLELLKERYTRISKGYVTSRWENIFSKAIINFKVGKMCPDYRQKLMRKLFLEKSAGFAANCCIRPLYSCRVLRFTVMPPFYIIPICFLVKILLYCFIFLSVIIYLCIFCFVNIVIVVILYTNSFFLCLLIFYRQTSSNFVATTW